MVKRPLIESFFRQVRFFKTGINHREEISGRCKTVNGTDADAVLPVRTRRYTGREEEGTPTVRAAGYTGRVLCGYIHPSTVYRPSSPRTSRRDSSPRYAGTGAGEGTGGLFNLI